MQQADQIIDKILQSNAFAQKEVLKGLLKFLFEAYKKQVAVKEADIAVQYFKRGNDFISGDDTIVRVNIHKLRSLLEKYYTEEGDADLLKVEIPKGGYAIVFVKKGGEKESAKPNKMLKKVALGILIVSVLGNIGWLVTFLVQKQSTKQHPVWSDFLKAGQSVNLILGDPYFFKIKDSSAQSLIVRDITINSGEDLKRNYAGKSHVDNSGLAYPYFSKNNVWPLPEIISVFAKADVDVRLQSLSELNAEELKRENLVFIANINSFGLMNKFLENTSIQLYTNPRQLSVNKDSVHLSFSVPEIVQGYYTDYAFLVKRKQANGKVMCLMGDFHASGIKGLARYITEKTTLNELEVKVENDFGPFPESFEMVVKVTSYNRADFETQLIFFRPL